MGLLDKLFKPQWMDEDERKAKHAVAKVDDPETLRRIMAEAPTSRARAAAMEKLDNQELYREVALTSDDADLVLSACRHIDDLATLESVLERDLTGFRYEYKCAVGEQLLSVKRMELDALASEVPEMCDAARLVDLGAYDPEEGISPHEWSFYIKRRSYRYECPENSAGSLRRAVVRRLAELGDDAGLAEVIRRTADDEAAGLAVASVRDKGVLDRLALGGGLGYKATESVIAHMENAEILRELTEVMDPFEIIPKAAMKRLAKLPCTDGEAHEWVTISEEDNSALGAYSEGHHTIDWVKRCRKCGIELGGSS